MSNNKYQVTISVVQGANSTLALYVNNYRVCGQKPSLGTFIGNWGKVDLSGSPIVSRDEHVADLRAAEIRGLRRGFEIAYKCVWPSSFKEVAGGMQPVAWHWDGERADRNFRSAIAKLEKGEDEDG